MSLSSVGFSSIRTSLVFVKQTFVVHLPGDRAFLAGGGVFENEDLVGLRADRLGDGHAGGSVGVHQKFRPETIHVRRIPMRQSGEQSFAGIIFAGSVVPTAAVGWLKLNSAEGIERWLPFGRGRAINQNASPMIRRRSANVPHIEDEPVVAVFALSV